MKKLQLLFLGLEGVGKTSLYLYMLGYYFVDMYDKTSSLITDTKNVMYKNELYRCTLMDTPGEKKLGYLYRKYYDSTDIFLLVCDVSNVNSLLYVKKMAEELVDRGGIYIIFNKYSSYDNTNDDVLFDIKSNILDRYGVGFRYVDLKTDYNTDGMMEDVLCEMLKGSKGRSCDCFDCSVS